jgi:hypothetical protein
MHDIYIPSKGRADTCLTAKILESENIDFKIVIEPQDLSEYQKHYPASKLLVMPENNKGIAYVRNFCKDHSNAQQQTHHWQLDDNIKSFRIRQMNKNVKQAASACLKTVEYYEQNFKNIGISGLRHTMFAFSQKESLSFNQQCYSAVLVNNKTPIRWRDKIVEDTDYSLQLLMNNYVTVLFNRVLIEKAVTMSMKGGHTDSTYKGSGRGVNQQNLCNAYPGIFELTEQYGRTKIKPSRIWRTFKQRPIPV